MGCWLDLVRQDENELNLAQACQFYPPETIPSDDVFEEAETPIYDSFVRQREGVRTLTGFLANEFDHLHALVQSVLETEWCTVKGRTCSVHPKDAFLVIL